jgi:VIT1/CCC1 family predicted Fe2+/Mn2+ transporter
MKIQPPHEEHHFSNRTGWIRAGVLGANDGLISISGLVIGVAATGASHETLLLATLSALIAGALSMAAGEFISVGAQSDIEKYDIKREEDSLRENPDEELAELKQMYTAKGLEPDLAEKVAVQLTKNNALHAHLMEELGFTEVARAKQLQAALVSLLAFLTGGGVPTLVAWFAEGSIQAFVLPATLVGLAVLGFVSARLGGVPALRSVLRVVIVGIVVLYVSDFLGGLANF